MEKTENVLFFRASLGSKHSATFRALCRAGITIEKSRRLRYWRDREPVDALWSGVTQAGQQ